VSVSVGFVNVTDTLPTDTKIISLLNHSIRIYLELGFGIHPVGELFVWG
jgi:hypothetical protein